MSLKRNREHTYTANGLTRADVMRMARQHKTQRGVILSGAVREVGGPGAIGEPLTETVVVRAHRLKIS